MEKYSKIRMWGSVGFILISVTLSEIMMKAGSNWFWYVLILMNLTLIFSLKSLNNFEVIRESSSKISSPLIEKKLILYFIVFFLFELSHAPYHGFFQFYW
ncbi:permease [Paenibacillus popilliae ATCC 14706]|uniref:Permease n=1 Tax=Paenibacillus popilliae ATCC 14706 TaxID=1212764 RepID=M9M7W7_PAEPP|nr:permease [Paenibacillus popilliae ATCC 14706]